MTTPANNRESARQMARGAGAISIILGVGFGLPCLYGMWVLARHGRIAVFLGFPTYGSGPFEAAGLRTTVPLLAAYFIVCTMEVAVGISLWTQQRAGLLAAVWLLPLEALFWVGFDLPYGPPLAALRTGLVLATLWVSRRITLSPEGSWARPQRPER